MDHNSKRAGKQYLILIHARSACSENLAPKTRAHAGPSDVLPVAIAALVEKPTLCGTMQTNFPEHLLPSCNSIEVSPMLPVAPSTHAPIRGSGTCLESGPSTRKRSAMVEHPAGLFSRKLNKIRHGTTGCGHWRTNLARSNLKPGLCVKFTTLHSTHCAERSGQSRTVSAACVSAVTGIRTGRKAGCL